MIPINDIESGERPGLYDIPISGPPTFSLSDNRDCPVIFVNAATASSGIVIAELIHNLSTNRTLFEQPVPAGAVADSISDPRTPVVAGRLSRRRSRTDVVTSWLLAPLAPDEMDAAREWAAEHLVRIADGSVEVDYGAFGST